MSITCDEIVTRTFSRLDEEKEKKPNLNFNERDDDDEKIYKHRVFHFDTFLKASTTR